MVELLRPPAAAGCDDQDATLTGLPVPSHLVPLPPPLSPAHALPPPGHQRNLRPTPNQTVTTPPLESRRSSIHNELPLHPAVAMGAPARLHIARELERAILHRRELDLRALARLNLDVLHTFRSIHLDIRALALEILGGEIVARQHLRRPPP